MGLRISITAGLVRFFNAKKKASAKLKINEFLKVILFKIQ